MSLALSLRKINTRANVILTPVTTVAAIVVDILMPLAPIGLWVTFGMIGLAAIILIGGGFATRLFSRLSPGLDQGTLEDVRKRIKSGALICMVISAVFGGTYALAGKTTGVNGEPVGLLSYNFPRVTEFQEELGVIDEQLKVVVQELDDISVSVDAIEQDTSEIVRQNSMNLSQINNAMAVGDMQSLENAADQGFNFDVVNNTLGDNVTRTHLVMALRSNKHNIDEVLTFLDEQGSVHIDGSIVAQNAFPTELQDQITQHINENNAALSVGREISAVNANLTRKQTELNTLNSEIRACRESSQTTDLAVIQRAGEIRLAQHRSARAYNQSQELDLIDQYNAEKSEEVKESQLEWDKRSLNFIEQIESGEIGQGVEGMQWKIRLEAGMAVPSLNVETRPSPHRYTTTLPPGYFEPKAMMSIEQAEAQARDELSSTTKDCGDSSVLASEVQALREEAQQLAQSAASVNHTPPQPRDFTSHLLLEAVFANNQGAVDWIIAKGGDPNRPGELEFSDGSTLAVTPAELM